jgi:hypothetical protein
LNPYSSKKCCSIAISLKNVACDPRTIRVCWLYYNNPHAEGERDMKSVARLALLATVGVCASSAAAQADTFNLTSCHISTGCPTAGTVFGTVTLTTSGTGVLVDVVLNNGSRFVETGSVGGFLFVFNDSLAGSAITTITATLNGVTQTTGPGNTFPGGFTGLTNQSPIHADGTGDWTAGVKCTTDADCNGGSIPNINDLHFTVTNATLAQLEITNGNGNFFAADILCGATVTGCAGQTGPVDVSTPAVPGPIVGAGLPGLVMACAGLVGLARRRRQKIV